MPPKAVRTVRDLIYWQYAKLIAESAGYGKNKNYGFIMDRFQQLKNGEIECNCGFEIQNINIGLS